MVVATLANVVAAASTSTNAGGPKSPVGPDHCGKSPAKMPLHNPQKVGEKQLSMGRSLGDQLGEVTGTVRERSGWNVHPIE